MKVDFYLDMQGYYEIKALLNGTDEIEFPDNFIIEFDLIPDNQFDYGIELTLYQEDKSDPKELNDNLYPGIGEIQIVPKKDGWETKG